jgi:hypothetical protein
MNPNTDDAEQDSLLLAWWLEELDDARAAEVEERVFNDEAFAARLRSLVGLRDAVQRGLLEGRFTTTVNPQFVQRLKDSGLNIREYRVPPGGSVLCTIAPHDDLVVSRLQASLAGVRQLDIVFDYGEVQQRAAHIPFDAAADEVTVIPPVAMVRKMSFATHRMRLLAVTPTSERVIGEYTFNHEPWGA